jgi:tetratricopeptide (TPR) repeat protein
VETGSKAEDENAMHLPEHKALKHLTAADGYLDLGMPDHAVAELEQVGPAGEVEPAVQYLLGQALKQQRRFREAIDCLHLAATQIPAPLNRGAWVALEECYLAEGEAELAEVVNLFATTSGIPAGWGEPLDELVEPEFLAEELSPIESPYDRISPEDRWPNRWH